MVLFTRHCGTPTLNNKIFMVTKVYSELSGTKAFSCSKNMTLFVCWWWCSCCILQLLMFYEVFFVVLSDEKNSWSVLAKSQNFTIEIFLWKKSKHLKMLFIEGMEDKMQKRKKKHWWRLQFSVYNLNQHWMSKLFHFFSGKIHPIL